MTFVEFQQIVKLGKSRSDCSSGCIDQLVERIEAHASGVRGDIIECGSYRCGATIAMAAAAEYYGRANLNEKWVYALDTWDGLPYGEKQQGFENFGDVDYLDVLEATRPFGITLIRGKHEIMAPRFVENFDGPVSLLFMDSDFYDSHVVCLRNFWPLLSRDGCVMFHDWTFQGVQQAIRDAVNDNEYNRYDLGHNMGMIVKK